MIFLVCVTRGELRSKPERPTNLSTVCAGRTACIVGSNHVDDGKALSRARELASVYLKAPEVTRRNTRVHFIQPLKERIVREVGYGLSLEGASAADLVKSMRALAEKQPKAV